MVTDGRSTIPRPSQGRLTGQRYSKLDFTDEAALNFPLRLTKKNLVICNCFSTCFGAVRGPPGVRRWGIYYSSTLTR